MINITVLPLPRTKTRAAVTRNTTKTMTRVSPPVLQRRYIMGKGVCLELHSEEPTAAEAKDEPHRADSASTATADSTDLDAA